MSNAGLLARITAHVSRESLGYATSEILELAQTKTAVVWNRRLRLAIVSMIRMVSLARAPLMTYLKIHASEVTNRIQMSF